ncbi:MAG: Type restriction-modification system, specificity subunit [Candidatus Sulfotelmatobacter sp.]|nr:Type restriction-modification system, specificity subunit [Candidatus Sulfotelmatobacter sp.]
MSESPQLPSGWATAAISEVADQSVKQAKPSGSGNFLYVDISSIDRSTKHIVGAKVLPVESAPSRARQHLLPGDVLISMTRPNLNAVAMLPSEMGGAIGSTGFFVLRSRHVVPNWLFYLVQTADFIGSMSRAVLGVLYPAVRPKDIASYSFDLPPVQEQGRIVAEIEKQLTRLDAAMAGLKRVQTNLKRYRAATLNAACEGRLVPTEAELARKEGRSYETGEQLLARILKERRAKWETDQLAKMHASGKPPKNDEWKKKNKEPDSPEAISLPKLPNGWAWASLGQIADMQGGIQKQPSRTPRENVYPFLRVANVYRGRLDLSEIHHIEIFGDELSKLRLCAGDLLIVEGNGSPTEIGRMAVWNGEINNCVHQNHIIRARLLSGIRPGYCAAYWNSSLGSSEVTRVAGSTSGLYTLSVGKLTKIAIPIPPIDEQDRIVSEMERVLSTLADVEPFTVTSLRRAHRLRQSILKRAFKGKLVPQDPSDEPASVLLERIRAQHTNQEPKRKIKKADRELAISL